jgi:hypothetical protein
MDMTEGFEAPGLRPSLNEIEGRVFEFEATPTDSVTPLVARVMALRAKPLNELTPADLRTLIAQQEGLEQVVPLAIDALTDDVLISADLYQGDLLSAILRVPQDFWLSHPDLRNRAELLRETAEEIVAGINEDLRVFRGEH